MTISLSPTEELATKEASYARPTVKSLPGFAEDKKSGFDLNVPNKVGHLPKLGKWDSP